MTMIERVATAIEAVRLFSRWNDWTSDRVEGLPVEICQHAGDDIVVLQRFGADTSEAEALALVTRAEKARAAIEAMRELPIGFDMIGAVELVKHSRFSLAYRAVIEAMLVEGGPNAD